MSDERLSCATEVRKLSDELFKQAGILSDAADALEQIYENEGYKQKIKAAKKRIKEAVE